MTKEELASMFDHTFLKAYASRDDFIKLCDEAKDIGAAMVAINSEPVKLCKELLKGTSIHVGAAISFPLGQTTLNIKLAETKQAIDDGADEIDYVINIGKAKMHDWNYIEQEMRSIVELCHENQVICKVIFENCYLTKEEIIEIKRMGALIQVNAKSFEKKDYKKVLHFLLKNNYVDFVASDCHDVVYRNVDFNFAKEIVKKKYPNLYTKLFLTEYEFN